MIKNFKFELAIFAVLLFGIFVLYNFDIGLYLYFKEYNESLNNIYLKEFFINVTTLGDSFWYFLIFVFSIVFISVYEKARIKSLTSLKKIKRILYFALFSLLFAGAVTQILKHIIGRPRPNHTKIDSAFGFDFFSLESAFHSFPSGHTSTIFILSIICAALIPKLKYFFYILGSLVAFSRVVVGAHFFTDVIAGVVVASICFKIMNLIYLRKFEKHKIQKIVVLNDSWFYCFLIVCFLIMLMLAVGPSFDLFISSLFYKGDKQFVLQSYYTLTFFFRDVALPVLLFYILIFPFISKWMPIKKLYFKYEFSTKDLLFIWSAFTLNTIVIYLLKNIWGRGRPGEVLQLGGGEYFTPWYQISDACSENCSFVSGDAAVGFALVLLFFVSKNLNFLYLSIVFGFVFGVVRIAEGAHFLSDVVFSGIIVFSLSLVFKTLFRTRLSD